MTDASRERSSPAPAGWYHDSIDPGRMRWWDGTAWTDHDAVPEATGAPARRAWSYQLMFLPCYLAATVWAMLGGPGARMVVRVVAASCWNSLTWRGRSAAPIRCHFLGGRS